MKKGLTLTRAVLAVASMALEQLLIWLLWRYVLPHWNIVLPESVLIGAMIGWGIIGTAIFIVTTSVLKKETPSAHNMAGLKGTAVTPLSPEGTVKVKGELWRARAEGDAIEKDEEIEVVGGEHLMLLVRKAKH